MSYCVQIVQLHVVE